MQSANKKTVIGFMFVFVAPILRSVGAGVAVATLLIILANLIAVIATLDFSGFDVARSFKLWMVTFSISLFVGLVHNTIYFYQLRKFLKENSINFYFFLQMDCIGRNNLLAGADFKAGKW
jgi:hypothetical protein